MPKAKKKKQEAVKAEDPKAEAPAEVTPEPVEAPKAPKGPKVSKETKETSAAPKQFLQINPKLKVEVLNVVDVVIPAGSFKKVYLANHTTEVVSAEELALRLK